MRTVKSNAEAMGLCKKGVLVKVEERSICDFTTMEESLRTLGHDTISIMEGNSVTVYIEL